jgi:short-subunit dehydrogenase
MKEFKNKNCFITGAASGIGRSFALALAKEGMNLFITDINMQNLEKVKKEVEELGVKAYAGKCDVSKLRDFEVNAKEFNSKLGDLDLLINNAGIAIGGDILDLEIEDWKQVLDINLWSIIYSIKVFLPHMLEREAGHIVNVASGAGVFGSAEPLPYITSKFGVVGLSEALFGRLKNHGINVSVIIPSYIRTNIFFNAKIKYPQKLMEDIGKEKLEEIYNSILKDMVNKAMSPDRAVKKYIMGIKKDQLYISDIQATISIMALKGNNPQQYEKFLVDYNDQFMKAAVEHFAKYGINIEKYR